MHWWNYESQDQSQQRQSCDISMRDATLPVHVTPSPINPSLQAQLKLPSELVQVAFPWQVKGFVHSSMSVNNIKMWLNLEC